MDQFYRNWIELHANEGINQNIKHANLNDADDSMCVNTHDCNLDIFEISFSKNTHTSFRVLYLLPSSGVTGKGKRLACLSRL
jgi:hypothetical protein